VRRGEDQGYFILVKTHLDCLFPAQHSCKRDWKASGELERKLNDLRRLHIPPSYTNPKRGED
jgi:hypothetical protein